MADMTSARLGALADRRWGLVTTAQAARAGVTRAQLSRMATAGALERVAHGVYRVAGAPEHPRQAVLATWLALGGADRPATGTGVSPVVAAGSTAAGMHGIGDLLEDTVDLVVPARRLTRLPGVRLRVRALSPADVVPVDGLPCLTVERTVADLVELGTDRSLVAGVVRDALGSGALVDPSMLVGHLDAARTGRERGRDVAGELLALAGADPLEWLGG